MTTAAAPPIHVVLCRPSHPGNIGGAARALRVMGLSSLRLVAPRIFPSEEARQRATGAADVLDAASVHGTLADALADCSYVLGLSARDRAEGPPRLDIRDGARLLCAHAVQGPVALVFGNERTGLENDELNLCHALARIPTGETLSSLNLAAAVQVASYEVMRALTESQDLGLAQDVGPPATRDTLDALFERMWRQAKHHPKVREDDGRVALIRARFEQLLARARPSDAEIRAAHGMLSWLDLRKPDDSESCEP